MKLHMLTFSKEDSQEMLWRRRFTTFRAVLYNL